MKLKILFFFSLIFGQVAFSMSWEESNIPFPTDSKSPPTIGNNDVLPYFMQGADGRMVQISAQPGCSSTPVTMTTERHQIETWNNRYSGRSSYSSNYRNSGSNAESASAGSYSDRGATVAASGTRERWSSSGSDYSTSSFNHHLQGSLETNDRVEIVFYPCYQVQQ